MKERVSGWIEGYKGGRQEGEEGKWRRQCFFISHYHDLRLIITPCARLSVTAANN